MARRPVYVEALTNHPTRASSYASDDASFSTVRDNRDVQRRFGMSASEKRAWEVEKARKPSGRWADIPPTLRFYKLAHGDETLRKDIQDRIERCWQELVLQKEQKIDEWKEKSREYRQDHKIMNTLRGSLGYDVGGKIWSIQTSHTMIDARLRETESKLEIVESERLDERQRAAIEIYQQHSRIHELSGKNHELQQTNMALERIDMELENSKTVMKGKDDTIKELSAQNKKQEARIADQLKSLQGWVQKHKRLEEQGKSAVSKTQENSRALDELRQKSEGQAAVIERLKNELLDANKEVVEMDRRRKQERDEALRMVNWRGVAPDLHTEKVNTLEKQVKSIEGQVKKLEEELSKSEAEKELACKWIEGLLGSILPAILVTYTNLKLPRHDRFFYPPRIISDSILLPGTELQLSELWRGLETDSSASIIVHVRAKLNQLLALADSLRGRASMG
jgi:hypothetical protein